MFEHEDDHDDHAHEEEEHDHLGVAHEPAYIGLMLAVCFVAVLLNITLVSFNWLQRGLNSSINVFLTNLAVSDTLMAGVVTPLYFQIDTQNHENFTAGVGLCKMFMSLQLFNVVVAIFTVATMAIDRYRCIIKQKTLNRRMAVICVACLWTISFIISIPQLYEYDLHSHIEIHDNETEVRTLCGPGRTNDVFTQAYSSILFVVCYLMPLGLLIISYACIVMYLYRHSRQLRRSHDTIEQEKIRRQSNCVPKRNTQSNQGSKGHSQTNREMKPKNQSKSVQKTGSHSNREQTAHTQSNHAEKTQNQSNGFQKTGSHSNREQKKHSRSKHAQKTQSQPNDSQKRDSESNSIHITYIQTNRLHLKETIIRRRLKVIKMLISITVMFATLWSPYFILFLKSRLDGTDDSTMMHTWPHVISRVMTVIGPISNPAINLIFNRDLRKYIVCYIIRCRFCCRKHNRVKPAFKWSKTRTDAIVTVCT